MGLLVPGCAGMGLAAALGVLDPVQLRDAAVSVSPPPPVAPGKGGELSLTILERPFRGTPVELWLDADDVRLPDNRVGWEDVVDPQAQQPRLRARFVAPDAPGTYYVRGWVMYVRCGPKRCRPRTRSVLWTITVVAPAQTTAVPDADPRDAR